VRLATARYEAYGISQPSDQVGGDLVDIVPLDDELFVYVADIAGHGLQAGILMGMLKTATRAILLAKPTLAQQMDQLNRILPQVKEPHMYAPFAGLRLRAAGTIEYGIAAHPPILHFRAREHEVVQLSQEQFPLGLLPDVDYQCLTTQVSDGDILLITTDGILEASNAGGEEFGLDRLKLLLAELAAEPAERLADAILGRVRQYGPADDDQTLLVVRAIAVGAAN
jgi:serine phosphatase RsbU (regulator of sigma subunit)